MVSEFLDHLEALEYVELDRDRKVKNMVGKTVVDFLIGDRVEDYERYTISDSSVVFEADIQWKDGSDASVAPGVAEWGDYADYVESMVVYATESTIHLPTLDVSSKEEARNILRGYELLPEGFEWWYRTPDRGGSDGTDPHIEQTADRVSPEQILVTIEMAHRAYIEIWNS